MSITVNYTLEKGFYKADNEALPTSARILPKIVSKPFQTLVDGKVVLVYPKFSN